MTVGVSTLFPQNIQRLSINYLIFYQESTNGIINIGFFHTIGFVN
jgi:hypothetical protein